jgi:hypothetical protein
LVLIGRGSLRPDDETETVTAGGKPAVRVCADGSCIAGSREDRSTSIETDDGKRETGEVDCPQAGKTKVSYWAEHRTEWWKPPEH